MDRMHTPPSYSLFAWLFLRGLGMIYCAAFASLAVQITALAGADGIYPISEQLDIATQRFGGMRWLSYPSLFWIAAGDWALLAVAWGGAALALLLVVGRGGRWPLAAGVAVPVLPVALSRRAGVHEFPMGLLAAGNRLHRHPAARRLPTGGLAVPVGAVQAAILIRPVEAAQRR